MLSSRFESNFQMPANTQVFSLTANRPWLYRARYLLVFVGLVFLSMHLSSLMAKNDAKPVTWTPPVEPPGAVTVTSNTFTPLSQHLRVSPAAQVPSDKLYVVGRSPETASPTPAKEAATEDLIAALSQWSDAWRRQDMAAYLGAYSPVFVPAKGTSREAWAKQRTARITAKQSIRHEVRDVDVQFDQNKAIVKFTQVYADERLQQTDQKTMHWELNNGRWQIAREVAH